MVKAIDFNLDRYFLMDKTDMTPHFFSKSGRGQGQVTPNFGGKNANSTKTVRGYGLQIWYATASFYGQYGYDPHYFCFKGGVARVVLTLIFRSHPCLRPPLGEPPGMSG